MTVVKSIILIIVNSYLLASQHVCRLNTTHSGILRCVTNAVTN